MNKYGKRRMAEKRDVQNQRDFGKYFALIVVIVFTVFIGRFLYIAVTKKVSGNNLVEIANQTYHEKSTLKASRGTIYDASGQPIVEDTKRYSIYVVLSKTAVAYGQKLYLKNSDKNKAAEILHEYLGMDVDKLLSLFSQPKYQIELGKKGQNISLSTKNQIVKEMKKSKITGINFSESTDRMYPNGIFSSHLIGVVSKDSSGTLYGTMGLEALYDNYLKGKDGYDMRSTDSHGIKLSGMKSRLVKAKDGDNIYTTFNSRDQSYLESLLNKAQETYHPKSMNVVLMNAKTGAILAASQRPTFNPQTREGIEDQWKNTLMEDTYEPGSVMKILTMSAAINSGNYNENEYFKSGSMKIGNSQRVNDWEVAGWGYLNYRQGFIRSSNVGMAKLEQKMGAKLWEKYIKKFGLLKSTDSGLSSNESSGSIEYKYPIEQANTAFGQGINVTVLQMMQAFSSVANNGEMVKPYLIEKIVNPTTGKTIKTGKKTVVGHPIKKSTAEKVRDMMQDVVNDPNGTGNAYKIDGYDIGVKTGTAQISGNNGYLTGETNYIFSVAGMAPIKNPQYVLYVTMKQPAGFGGKTPSEMLATIFNPLMKRVLDESQGESTPSEAINVKSVVGQETGNAVKSFSDKGLVVTAIGNGAKIIKQSSDTGEELLPGQRIILVTDSGQTLPDLKGWTKSDMFKLKNLLGINVKFKGSGFVENQSVKPGTKIADIKELTVELK